MRTWSIESVFVRAYSTVVNKLAALEGLTRPPHRGHGMDAVDGAEQLAELEAEEEVREPLNFNPNAHAFGELAEPDLTSDELAAVRRWLDLLEKGLYPDTGEVFAPREPMLRYSELWAVRQLLAERFDAEGVDRFTQAAAEAYRAMTSSADPLQASATCGDARTADDSGEELSGHSPRSSSSPRPDDGTVEIDLRPRVGQGGGVDSWSDLAERMVNHLPSAEAEDDDFQPLEEHELWSAGHYIDNWAASDNCDDTPIHQKYLHELATRLRDASRAMRNQQ